MSGAEKYKQFARDAKAGGRPASKPDEGTVAPYPQRVRSGPTDISDTDRVPRHEMAYPGQLRYDVPRVDQQSFAHPSESSAGYVSTLPMTPKQLRETEHMLGDRYQRRSIVQEEWLSRPKVEAEYLGGARSWGRSAAEKARTLHNYGGVGLKQDKRSAAQKDFDERRAQGEGLPSSRKANEPSIEEIDTLWSNIPPGQRPARDKFHQEFQREDSYTKEDIPRDWPPQEDEKSERDWAPETSDIEFVDPNFIQGRQESTPTRPREMQGSPHRWWEERPAPPEGRNVRGAEWHDMFAQRDAMIDHVVAPGLAPHGSVYASHFPERLPESYINGSEEKDPYAGFEANPVGTAGRPMYHGPPMGMPPPAMTFGAHTGYPMPWDVRHGYLGESHFSEGRRGYGNTRPE